MRRAARGVLDLTATSAHRRFLVISEVWHPGWTATVDGKPATLHRTNIALQGLWLDPGPHHVRLRFWPTGLSAGLIVTGVTICALLVCLGLAFRRGSDGRGFRGDTDSASLSDNAHREHLILGLAGSLGGYLCSPKDRVSDCAATPCVTTSRLTSACVRNVAESSAAASFTTTRGAPRAGTCVRGFGNRNHRSHVLTLLLVFAARCAFGFRSNLGRQPCIATRRQSVRSGGA